MPLTDEEIIKKLNIKPSDRVLDIGGSMMQHPNIKIDTLVDLIRPEAAPYGRSRLLAKHFVKADITREKLPFKNKEFDVCLCTHTLEDLPTPFPVMDEMQRVAKRGLIVTPSMGEDMSFSDIDYTNWLVGPHRDPGLGHHKWFIIMDGKKLKIIPKIYPVLYASQFQIVKWTGEKETVYFWDGKIEYEEEPGLNVHALIDEYTRYVNKNKKFISRGVVAIFVDNPFKLARALLKWVLKRGVGYSFRKIF